MRLMGCITESNDYKVGDVVEVYLDKEYMLQTRVTMKVLSVFSGLVEFKNLDGTKEDFNEAVQKLSRISYQKHRL